jgi:hypothetical protein
VIGGRRVNIRDSILVDREIPWGLSDQNPKRSTLADVAYSMITLSEIAGSMEPRSDGSRRRVWILAVAASILVVLPVFAAHHLPLLDAPGHEARLAVLRDLLITGRGSNFYYFDSFFLPNIAFDLIGLGLAGVMDPESAGRVFFALTLLLTLWGVLVLNRVAIGRWSAAPLASSLLLYNMISIFGFFSYLFGLSLVPWALAARLRLERGQPVPRFLLGAAIAAILLFCHVFAFAIYGVMSAGFAVAAWIARQIIPIRAIAWAFELVPAFFIYVVMSHVTIGGIEYEPHYFSTKLSAIVTSLTSGSLIGDIAFITGTLVFILLVIGWSRTRVVWSFIPGLIVLTGLYFALPFELASGSYVDKRMLIPIALIGLAGLDIRMRRSTTGYLLVGLVGMALVVKQGAIAVLWRSLDPLIDAIAASLDKLPANSIVMQAECRPNSSEILGAYRERQPAVTHLPALGALDDSRFVSSTWAIAGQQPIKVKPAYRQYYHLYFSHPPSICTASEYKLLVQQIEDLAKAEEAVTVTRQPIYLILLRPPKKEMLSSDATLIDTGHDYELYAVQSGVTAPAKDR